MTKLRTELNWFSYAVPDADNTSVVKPTPMVTSCILSFTLFAAILPAKPFSTVKAVPKNLVPSPATPPVMAAGADSNISVATRSTKNVVGAFQ